MPPRPQDKMRIPSAAFLPKSNGKLAATDIAETPTAPAQQKQKKNGKSRKSKDEGAAAAIQATVKTTPSNSNTQTDGQKANDTPPSTGTTSGSKKAFESICNVCKETGHRARDCPQRGERLVCFGCGKLDVISKTCDSAYCTKRRAQKNSQAGQQSGPATPCQN